MLRSLYINNIALINSQNIEFCDHFNVLSGETGAGKSIIVDSLMLLLGGKFDKILLRYGETSCKVEAEFDTTERVRELLNEYGIEPDDSTIICRKMNSDGRNENRINGRPVTITAIKEIGKSLIDICGQNEYQFLSNVNNHIKILDAFIGERVENLLSEYGTKLSELRNINKQLQEIQEGQEREDSIDYFKKRLAEINKIGVQPGEEEELEETHKKYRSAAKILSALNSTTENLSERVVDGLVNATKTLGTISSLGQNYSSLCERINAALIEAEDIADTLEEEIQSLEFTDNDIDELEDRLQSVRQLSKKYGGYDGICKKKAEIEQKIDFLENADEIYEKLCRDKDSVIKTLYDYAVKITQNRRAGAQNFEKYVATELNDLGMPSSQFKIVFSDLPGKQYAENRFNSNALDIVEFYLSPNPGQPLKPLTKIISGGEQSRFMLALKIISGNSDEIPTLVFDEIDVGISGRIGLEVSKKLAMLSRTHQVLCVTHLPQIAAMADENYFIEKSATDEQTITEITHLDALGQIDEIARLSGGKDISENVRATAKEMKDWSEKFKQSL